MKKFIVVFINIIVFVLLFCTLNYFTEKYYAHLMAFVNEKVHFQVKYTKSEIDKYDVEPFPDDFIELEWSEENYKKFCGEKRIEFGQNFINKEPIIILGCSYSYGHGIKKEASFPALLSQITQHPVYSFSKCGASPVSSINDMEIYLNDHPELKNAKYVIYIYMYDHINRLLLYKEFDEMSKMNDEREGKKHIFNRIYLLKYISNYIKIRSLLGEKAPRKNTYSYIKNAILNINFLVKKQFPNSKFIIIVYDEKITKGVLMHNIPYVADVLNADFWYDMPSDITIVKTKDIMGFKFNQNYKIKEDFAGIHPNEKAWSELTPKFAEKYID